MTDRWSEDDQAYLQRARGVQPPPKPAPPTLRLFGPAIVTTGTLSRLVIPLERLETARMAYDPLDPQADPFISERRISRQRAGRSTRSSESAAVSLGSACSR